METIIIYKSSPEGIHLNEMIKTKKPFVEIKQYLQEVVFKKLSFTDFLEITKVIRENAFIKGKREKENEIRKCLGIY